jgi:hypothetical protein
MEKNDLQAALIGAIQSQIDYHAGIPGASGKSQDWEAGFLAGLAQAKFVINAVPPQFFEE